MAHGWGARIQEAVLHLSAAQRRRIALEEFGVIVADAEGRESPYRRATVSNWANEVNEPTITTFETIAGLVGCDPWWLVWGVGRGPTNVLIDATKAVQKTEPANRAQK
jgi:hypothetical protein